ncbi:hypothetical protein HDV05_003399 [Chytridiales sp. JEL 0842]|nr:hypothetical protein HDV05_003399 [Chytridiales sp. JEL 0842]
MIAAASATSVPEGSAVRHHQPNCSIFFSPALNKGAVVPGKGDLYVTESELIFKNPTTSMSFSISYPSILIHAISRGNPAAAAENDEAKPCIYCQLDSGSVSSTTPLPTIPAASTSTVALDVNGEAVEGGIADESARAGQKRKKDADGEDEEEGEDDDDDVCELRIVPEDSTALDAIFQALSECAALHPDKDQEGDLDMDGDDDGWIYNASDEAEIEGLRAAALEHLENVFEGPFPGSAAAGGPAVEEGQFDDAEEEEAESGKASNGTVALESPPKTPTPPPQPSFTFWLSNPSLGAYTFSNPIAVRTNTLTPAPCAALFENVDQETLTQPDGTLINSAPSGKPDKILGFKCLNVSDVSLLVDFSRVLDPDFKRPTLERLDMWYSGSLADAANSKSSEASTDSKACVLQERSCGSSNVTYDGGKFAGGGGDGNSTGASGTGLMNSTVGVLLIVLFVGIGLAVTVAGVWFLVRRRNAGKTDEEAEKGAGRDGERDEQAQLGAKRSSSKPDEKTDAKQRVLNDQQLRDNTKETHTKETTQPSNSSVLQPQLRARAYSENPLTIAKLAPPKPATLNPLLPRKHESVNLRGGRAASFASSAKTAIQPLSPALKLATPPSTPPPLPTHRKFSPNLPIPPPPTYHPHLSAIPRAPPSIASSSGSSNGGHRLGMTIGHHQMHQPRPMSHFSGAHTVQYLGGGPRPRGVSGGLGGLEGKMKIGGSGRKRSGSVVEDDDDDIPIGRL